MLWGKAFFWITAAMAVIGALATVLSPNPIRGAMGLLLMILSIAGLFLALHAQFLAAIQLIVYAGAIVVLFLFVIMLIGPSAHPPSDERGRYVRFLSAATFVGAGATALYFLAKKSTDMGFKSDLLDQTPADFGSIDALGKALFTKNLVPFELSSALLMVAIIGAIAVARGRHASDPPKHQPDHVVPEQATKAGEAKSSVVATGAGGHA